MRVDPTTQLFEELTDHQAQELQRYGEAIMLRGDLSQKPQTVEQWCEVCDYRDDRFLLVAATVLPARIFYSLLLREQGKR